MDVLLCDRQRCRLFQPVLADCRGSGGIGTTLYNIRSVGFALNIIEVYFTGLGIHVELLDVVMIRVHVRHREPGLLTWP